MYNNIENAFSRNGVYIPEFNRYKNGQVLSRRNLETLGHKLRKYRNTHSMRSSNALNRLLKNVEENYVKASRKEARPLWEQLVLAKSRIRKIPKFSSKRVPFTAKNLQRVKLKPTPKINKFPKLQMLALAKVNKSKLPLHMLTPNQLRMLQKPKFPSLKLLKNTAILRKYMKNINRNNVNLNNYAEQLGFNTNKELHALETIVRGLLFETRLKKGGSLAKVQERYKRNKNIKPENTRKVLKFARNYASR